MAAKQFGDFYTHTLLIEQSTVRWVACLTMNKMSGADMNREIIIYNEHVKRTLIWLNFVTYIYNVHCAKHFGANSKNDICFCWVRYKNPIYLMEENQLILPESHHRVFCKPTQCFDCSGKLKIVSDCNCLSKDVTASKYFNRGVLACMRVPVPPYNCKCPQHTCSSGYTIKIYF